MIIKCTGTLNTMQQTHLQSGTFLMKVKFKYTLAHLEVKLSEEKNFCTNLLKKIFPESWTVVARIGAPTCFKMTAAAAGAKGHSYFTQRRAGRRGLCRELCARSCLKWN